MDLSRDIHSLTDFKKHTPEFVQQLKDTGEPVVLTINGKAELVVQDAASYQKLIGLAEEAKVIEGIRQGLEDAKAGRTISLDDPGPDLFLGSMRDAADELDEIVADAYRKRREETWRDIAVE